MISVTVSPESWWPVSGCDPSACWRNDASPWKPWFVNYRICVALYSKQNMCQPIFNQCLTVPLEITSFGWKTPQIPSGSLRIQWWNSVLIFYKCTYWAHFPYLTLLSTHMCTYSFLFCKYLPILVNFA